MNENNDAVSDCLHKPESLEPLQETQDEIKNRAAGMIAGNIIGDMIGVANVWLDPLLENKRPLEIDSTCVTEIIGNEKIFKLQPGGWTDDTSMLIALAESLNENSNRVNPMNEFAHYKKWFHEGAYTPNGVAFDIGKTTRLAIEKGEPPKGQEYNGNGGLMRSSIISVAYLDMSDASLDEASALSCAVTHWHPISKFCNVIYNRLLKKLILGLELKAEFEKLELEFAGLMEDIDKVFKQPEMYNNSGYVVTTLQTAIWICLESSTFEEAVVKAINLGGDSDTIGAVTGAIAGAQYGTSSIPEKYMKFVKTDELIKYKGIAKYLP